MKKAFLVVLFLALNGIAALCAFTMWNTSSMAAGTVMIIQWFTGGFGTLLGGHLAARNLYRSSRAHWAFALGAAATFLAVSFCPLLIEHPHEVSGPFPGHPWHEYGFSWIYLIVSSVWMLAQATRTK